MPEILTHCDNWIRNQKSVFNVLNEEEMEILMAHNSCRLYRKGEIIYKEGEKPMGLICLSEGKVKIYKEGIGGREQIIRLAKPIGFIGYRALFAEEIHIATAVAIEDSTICIIDKPGVYKLLRSNSELSIKIIKALATDLGFSNIRTVSLTQKHIRGRLAESLLFLVETYGFEKDGKTIKVYLSRLDLANLSSMTTSNAIRTLSAFSQEGVIELSGRKIIVNDMKHLERISEMG